MEFQKNDVAFACRVSSSTSASQRLDTYVDYKSKSLLLVRSELFFFLFFSSNTIYKANYQCAIVS